MGKQYFLYKGNMATSRILGWANLDFINLDMLIIEHSLAHIYVLEICGGEQTEYGPRFTNALILRGEPQESSTGNYSVENAPIEKYSRLGAVTLCQDNNSRLVDLDYFEDADVKTILLV